MRLLLAPALLLLAGCHAPPYRSPGWDPPPRAMVSAGCLVFAVRFFAEGAPDVPGIPTAISFHSTCKDLSVLDLRRVRVRARLESGTWASLLPYDPRGVLRAGMLAPGDTGEEPIEYGARDGAALPAWTVACFDFDALAPGGPVAGAVVCFDLRGRLTDPEAPAGAADGGAP